MMTRIVRVGLLSLFLAIPLPFAAAGAEANPSTVSGVARIVAIGDVHGDYDQLVKALKLGDCLNTQNHWKGGKTHVVQTGDVFDRGSDSIKCMDLLMALEAEAAADGGRVHVLLGNHEATRLGGQSREKDITPEELASYGGADAMKKALGPDGKYGAWVRRHNAVVKINDTLFVHGGISGKCVAMSLDDLNQKVREGLKSDKAHGLARDSAGPLNYRGLAKNPEETVVQEMQAISKAYDVSRVVIGHTVSTNGIVSRANGQVIMIDVGMTKSFGGKAACLVIEGKKVTVVTEKEKIPVPPAPPVDKAADDASSKTDKPSRKHSH